MNTAASGQKILIGPVDGSAVWLSVIATKREEKRFPGCHVTCQDGRLHREGRTPEVLRRVKVRRFKAKLVRNKEKTRHVPRHGGEFPDH